jgi:hypothetical protein
LAGAALVLIAASITRVACADDAQALFDEGLTDMKAGRFKIGCALIKQSLDVDPRAGTMFTLAECFSRAGKYASAVELYDRYLALVDTLPADQKEQQQARADVSRTERTRLVALVSWLTVTVPTPVPPGLVVTKDGEDFPLSLFGIATAVDPGPHVFTTRTPESPLIEQRIDIVEGERKQIRLDVQPGLVTPAPIPVTPGIEEPPGDAPPDRAHPLRPWAWVTGSIGAAGLITGGIAGGLLLAKRDTINSQCHHEASLGSNTLSCSPSGKAAADLAQNTLAPLTTVALSVGAAGAVATLVLLIVDGSNKGSQSSGRITPSFGVAPNAATAGLSGAF